MPETGKLVCISFFLHIMVCCSNSWKESVLKNIVQRDASLIEVSFLINNGLVLFALLFERFYGI